MKQLLPVEVERSKKLISVTESEWAKAKKYFEEHADAVKLSRGKNIKEHSFIKVDDIIYCLASSECFEEPRLGEGKFSVVRLAQTESGKEFAIKIEGRRVRTATEDDHLIAQVLGFSHGQVERRLKEPKLFQDVYTDRKLYTVEDYIPYPNLHEVLYQNPEDTIEPEQFLILMIKTASLVLGLHRLGIIHCDLKEPNFMANLQGSHIVIAAIDFGFSKIIDANEKKIIFDKTEGTPEYMAPEINNLAEYSFATDIYALGIMYQKIYRWPKETLDQLKQTLTHFESMPMDQQTSTHFEDIISIKESIEDWENLVERYRVQIDMTLGPLFSEMIAHDSEDRPSLQKVIEAGIEQLQRLLKEEYFPEEKAGKIVEVIQVAKNLLVEPDALHHQRQKILTRFQQERLENAAKKTNKNSRSTSEEKDIPKTDSSQTGEKGHKF